MHSSTTFDLAACLRAALQLKFSTVWAMRSEFHRRQLLSVRLTKSLRRAQRAKPVAAIVHNRHDRNELSYIHDIDRIQHHPLAFLTRTEAAEIRAQATRRQFPLLDLVPENAVLVGVFGFLGGYKGFETAIRAMQHLPENHHLLVFGAVHPNEIRRHQPVNPYISALMAAGYIDTTVPERLMSASAGRVPAVTFTLDQQSQSMLTGHPRDLSTRIHFMGAMKDRDFLSGMAICDTVVFPYMEVGQSASGPIAQAVELGCRVIASRTRTFVEFARYHPDRIEFFDIGNHLELAHRILARPQFDPEAWVAAYDVETNKATYYAANNTGLDAVSRPSPLRAAAAHT